MFTMMKVGVFKTAPSPLFYRPAQVCTFTKALKKIVLTQDVDNLGFKGEVCFVKPGYAFNSLVPMRDALFFSDPKATMFIKSVDVSLPQTPLSNLFTLFQRNELEEKQQMRNLEIFLAKLKDMRLVFQREVSEINKNVAK